MLKVSIIIPCRNLAEAKECIYMCKKTGYSEIIILPDSIATEEEYNYLINACDSPDIRVKPTGPILPSRKRDIGIKIASGEVVGFIDADAYPAADWLEVGAGILETFADITGVCGPGILPPGSPVREKAADNILKLLPHSYRVTPKRGRFLDDYPTFNLLLRKQAVNDVGGFSCHYLTGEDTLLCSKIIKAGGKIYYDPKVRVFHHRRPLFVPFLKQIACYGLHRGFFFKRHPATSRRVVYLLPIIGWAVICVCALLWWAYCSLR